MNIVCTCQRTVAMSEMADHRINAHEEFAPYIVGADSEVPGWNFGDRSVAAARSGTFTPDATDQLIMERRQATRDGRAGQFLVGDYVNFADDVTRRISHVWSDGVQTSDGGSWHLSGDGNGSFSGSLHPSVPLGTLTLLGKRRMGDFWFFHHDWARAHHAVYVRIAVQVWACGLPAN